MLERHEHELQALLISVAVGNTRWYVTHQLRHGVADSQLIPGLEHFPFPFLFLFSFEVCRSTESQYSEWMAPIRVRCLAVLAVGRKLALDVWEKLSWSVSSTAIGAGLLIAQKE